MFLHILGYGIKTMFREKTSLFWSLCFPFALATFMYLAFGDIFAATEKFEAIPVAVVQERENTVLESVLQELSKEGENQMLRITWTDEEEAKELLDQEKITGIIYENVNGHLVVRENGINESILQMLLSRIKQETAVMTEIALKHPENLEQAVQSTAEEIQYCQEEAYGSGNQDNLVNYFYAIFAMACLFAAFSSLDRTRRTQANTCPLGIRRCVTPTPKMTILCTEFLMGETIQFILVCLLYVYMRFVLHINLGDQYPAIGLLLLLGSSLGTMFGIFVGCLSKCSGGTQVGIIVSVSLSLCMLSDLMVSGVRDWIEHRIPLINKINPAALICDSFYALNVYDGYDRFAANMLMLALLTAVLAVISYLMVRRNRYASL